MDTVKPKKFSVRDHYLKKHRLNNINPALQPNIANVVAAKAANWLGTGSGPREQRLQGSGVATFQRSKVPEFQGAKIPRR